MEREYRKFNSEIKELRTETFEDGTATLEGYFIKYNTPAPCKPFNYYEQIAPEAVENTLNNDIRCLFNHNTDVVLGRTANNTLKLENRPDGLYGICSINLNDTEARNAYERVKRGDITGCSFGCWIIDEVFDEDKNCFTVIEIDLIEVSVCSFPFYPSTTMEARSRTEMIEKCKNMTKTESLKLEYLKREGEKRWH